MNKLTETTVLADQNTRPGRDEDIDNFMANLLSGQSVPVPKQQSRTFRRPRQSSAPKEVVDNSPLTTPRPKRRLKKGFKSLLILLLIAGISLGLFFAWQGPISGLLEPRSPFSQEIREKMGIPLYYPTELPGTFKMEVNSITQPESDVVIFVISDDASKRINITLQKQPEGISLDPLYAALQDLHDIQTKFGNIKTALPVKT